VPYLSEFPNLAIGRWYTGWVTLRNQLVTPIRLVGRRIIELYDALLAGNDLEITPRLTLMRRPGYLSYFNSQLNGAMLSVYSWRTASQGVYQIFDTTVDVEYVAPGVSAPVVIFTKPKTALYQRAFFFGVGNYLFGSGQGFSFKWDGGSPQGVTNWGIANTSGSSSGSAGAGANGHASALASWSNPNNVTSTTQYASVALTSYPTIHCQSNTLLATQFGLAASGHITGVQISFTAYCTGGGNTQLDVSPALSGYGFGNEKQLFLGVTPLTYVLGGSSDLWGFNNWSNTLVNGSTFGAAISAFNGDSNTGKTVFVDNVQITVFTGNVPTVSPTGSGSLTTVNGWSYVQAFGNSSSGEVSNASLSSANTGPFTNQAGVTVNLTASTDPQVNQIHVYRTTDSGGGAIFYELPTSPYPNTTGPITDTSPDTALNVRSIAATDLQNTPPPSNLVAMEWFAGRMWGAVGNLLYASTGPDSLSGLQPSNWNPAYVWVLPTAIQKLVATPNGMLVMCLDDCYVVRGTATINFTVNEFLRDMGTRSYNAVDTDGSNIYVFTSDRQFLQVAANGINDIGQNIGDQLLNVDPTQCYVSVYRYGLDSMLFLLDTVNGVLYPYNLNQQCWSLPALLKLGAKPTAAGTMEVSPGVWKYLVGAGTQVGQRDLNTFSDLGYDYYPQAVIGTIQVADALSLAKVENINLQLTNVGSLPSLSILANDTGVVLSNPVTSQITLSDFSQITGPGIPLVEPPTYAETPVNFINVRYPWGVTKVPQQLQYLQLLLQWNVQEAVQNELLALGISGKQEGGPQTQLPQLEGI